MFSGIGGSACVEKEGVEDNQEISGMFILCGIPSSSVRFGRGK